LKRLRLNKTLSKEWLTHSSRTLKEFLKYLEESEHWLNPETEIITHDFILSNNKSITNKYAKLINHILTNFEVLGVWKNFINPEDVTASIKGLRLYGYKHDVEEVKKILRFCIYGTELYVSLKVPELRLRKLKRRVKNREEHKRTSDVRKYVNNRVCKNIEKLNKVLLEHGFKHSPFYKAKNKKLLVMVREHEKIDYKKYKRLINPTYNSMRARIGYIQINKLV
jgi:hypothetical protein